VSRTGGQPQWVQGEALSQSEVIERACRWANHPTQTNRDRLFGVTASVSPAAKVLWDTASRDAARWFQDALSAIAHGRQTREQVEAWRQKAQGVEPSVTYAPEGRYVRSALLWRAPREVLEELPSPGEGLFVTENLDALLATVLLWLLDRDRPLRPALHECGRGEQCERERFFFRNRKYCSSKHTLQVNRATNKERSRDRRERNKAIELLKPQFPRRARALVWAVKARGLSAEQLVERAHAEAARQHK
jgi:hypothetical protein